MYIHVHVHVHVCASASERGNKFSPLEVLVHSLKLLCEARHIGTTCRVLKKMI